MKFSTRTTYGLRAMIHLARNWGGDCTSLSNIARKEKISLGYLERLFAKLKKAKLVKSEKGASGGYFLAKNPAQISVFHIIRVLEGKMTPFYCLSEDGKVYCAAKCKCGVTAVLLKVQKAVNSTLKNMKLKDLV